MPPQTKSSGRSLFDFGPWARDYGRWYETPAGQAHDRVQKGDVRSLLRPARDGARLLDVGCGTGHWSAFFAEMGYRVTGVDIATEMIQVARVTVPTCEFRVADAGDLPFEDGSFHVVAAMATLEFLPDPIVAIREMIRCASERGSLLIGTLNRLAPLNRHRLAKGREPYVSGRLLSPVELRALLEPWGRVRMLASSPRRQEGRTRLPGKLARRIPAFRRRLDGPFLVAEVGL